MSEQILAITPYLIAKHFLYFSECQYYNDKGSLNHDKGHLSSVREEGPTAGWAHTAPALWSRRNTRRPNSQMDLDQVRCRGEAAASTPGNMAPTRKSIIASPKLGGHKIPDIWTGNLEQLLLGTPDINSFLTLKVFGAEGTDSARVWFCEENKDFRLSLNDQSGHETHQKIPVENFPKWRIVCVMTSPLALTTLHGSFGCKKETTANIEVLTADKTIDV